MGETGRLVFIGRDLNLEKLEGFQNKNFLFWVFMFYFWRAESGVMGKNPKMCPFFTLGSH